MPILPATKSNKTSETHLAQVISMDTFFNDLHAEFPTRSRRPSGQLH